MSVVVDSHHHFWDRTMSQFDHSWQETEGFENICHSFLPQDLKPLLEQTGVQKTVLVQTQHDVAETEWFLQLADENDFVAGVVGWVDLQTDRCEQQLLAHREHPKFVGVRHVVQDEPDDDFIIRPAVLDGLRVLEKHAVPYDLLFYSKHLKNAAAVADHVPNLKLVIDHLSKPQIKSGEIRQWQMEMHEAAKRENLFCKISGMITEADWQNWKIEDLKPYVETVLECFGPSRLMFGTDWPVCLLAGSYQQAFDSVQQCVGSLSDDEARQLFGETASNFYSLNL